MHFSDKDHLEAERTERVGRVERATRESSIVCSVNLDGTGKTDISTGLPFFDHMLTAFVMGQAFAQALGDKSGIRRFGDCYIPMDETLAHAVVDVSGRPYFVGTGEPEQMLTAVIGGHYATVINEHFFESFALNARIALHVRCLYGRDPHHITEAEYKAVARALRAAVEDDPRVHGVPSTKGTL